MDVARLDLVSLSETTYRCPLARLEHCKWQLTCEGKHDDSKVRDSLSIHLKVHKRIPEGCPPYLDTMHVLDRGDWWITDSREIIRVVEMTNHQIKNAIEMLQRRAGLGLLSTYFPWWLKNAEEETIDNYERDLMGDPMKELAATETWKALTNEAARRGLSVSITT